MDNSIIDKVLKYSANPDEPLAETAARFSHNMALHNADARIQVLTDLDAEIDAERSLREKSRLISLRRSGEDVHRSLLKVNR